MGASGRDWILSVGRSGAVGVGGEDAERLIIYLFIYWLFRAASVAYGYSHARGISIATPMPEPSCVCYLHHSSW